MDNGKEKFDEQINDYANLDLHFKYKKEFEALKEQRVKKFTISKESFLKELKENPDSKFYIEEMYQENEGIIYIKLNSFWHQVK